MYQIKYTKIESKIICKIEAFAAEEMPHSKLGMWKGYLFFQNLYVKE